MEIHKFEDGSLQNIEAIEKKFAIHLPEDYRNFLLMNNGADIEKGGFYVKELKQTIPMGYFFGLNTKYKNADILKLNDEYEEDILDSSLLIGNDVGSGFILFITTGEDSGIWYYDHTYFFPQSSDELNTYFICETFTDFLKILENTPPPY